jgi:hypothetical protein
MSLLFILKPDPPQMDVKLRGKAAKKPSRPGQNTAGVAEGVEVLE